MRIVSFLLVLFSAVFISANCQWIHFNSDNTKGIKGTLVSSIIEDQNHNMWFGTEQGVTRFEKSWSIWTNYNVSNGLLNDFIYQVFEDKQGNIWVATNGGGVSKYSDGKWTNYTMSDGLPYHMIRAITQSTDGTLWFGTYGKGICSWRPETGFRKINASAIKNSYVLSMLAVSDKIILIGTLNQGLIILKDTSISFLTNRQDLSGEKVFSLYRDQTGGVWIGTNNGAQQCDLSTLSVLPCPDSLKGKTVYSIDENNSKEIIFATNEKLFQLKSGAWSSFIPANLNQSASFHAVFFDSTGRGWFGSSSQGLFMRADSLWYNYYRSTGLDNSYINGICEDVNHNIWASSYDDIYSFDSQNWHSMARANGLNSYNYSEIIADMGGNIWCLSRYYGLYRYNGENWITYSKNDCFSGSELLCIMEDKYGNIWAGTNWDGVYKFNGTDWTQYTTADGLASNDIAAIAIYPDGKILISSFHSELSVYDSISWKILSNVSADTYIDDMIIDDNNHIWFTTSYDIVKVEGGITMEYFTDAWYGFNCLAKDKKGHLWAGSSNGLYYFDGKNWYNFTTANGLSTNYINDVFIDSDDRIWLATYIGIDMSDHLTNNPEITIDKSRIITTYPNPFSNSLNLLFNSESAGNAQIQIYHLDGRFQKQLIEQKIVSGINNFHFETTEWPDGIIIYKIMLDGVITSGKMIKISTQLNQ